MCAETTPSILLLRPNNSVQRFHTASVRLGHVGDLPLLPLHPWERTSSASLISSEKCQNRKSARPRIYSTAKRASHPGQLGWNWSVLFENRINRWLGKMRCYCRCAEAQGTNASQRGAEEQEGRPASRQLVEERLCLFQVRGFEPLGEPAVYWREDIDGLVAFVVFGHYSGQRCGGTEFEKSSSCQARRL
jgi:hypothetical protein